MRTDRKQEVINFETFRSIFNEEWYRVVAGEGIAGRFALKNFYDRIAPPVAREFPEEEIRKYFRDKFFGVGSIKPQWMDEFIAVLKRLWEGDHIAGVREKVYEGRDKALKDLILDADLWTEEGLFRQIKILFEGQEPREGDNPPDGGLEQEKPVNNLEGGLWVLTGATSSQERQDEKNRAISRGLAKMQHDANKGTCKTRGGKMKKGRIRMGASYWQDFSGKKWPENPSDANLIFDIGPLDARHKRYTCTAVGHGVTGGAHKDYGCGSLFVKEEDIIFTCPNCGGTGECRHKDVKHIGGCLYCPDCRQYINDRRSGVERRKVESARRIHPDRRKAGPG